MSENTPYIMKSIRQSASRNFHKTIDMFRMYGRVKAYRILCIFILITLLIPSASAAITQWQITPENPVMGNMVAVTGFASPSEVISAKASYTDAVSPSLIDGKMRYEYLISHVKIPDGANTFTVSADGVKDINIKVQLYGVPVWTPSIGKDGSGGKATISQSNVPSGTHNIKIFGIAADGASTISLGVIAQQPITADPSGKFVYNYDSRSVSGITAGTKLTVTMNNQDPTKYPDLTPAINVPAKTWLDQNIDVTFTVRNIGQIGSGSTTLRITLDGDTYNVSVPAINAANSWNYEHSWTPDRTGTHTITAIVDPLDTIKEKIETNNLATVTTNTVIPTIDIRPNATFDDSIGGNERSSSGELLKNIVVTEEYSKWVYANELAVYNFHEPSNPIASIKFVPHNNMTVPVVVEVLKGVSTQVTVPAPNIAYRYMNIGVGASDNIVNVTAVFSVDLDWITDNDIDPGSIMLMHYSNISESWEALSTEMGDKENTRILYQAFISDFSPFAIVGKYDATVTPAKPDQTSSPETSTELTKVVPAKYILVTIVALFGIVYLVALYKIIYFILGKF